MTHNHEGMQPIFNCNNMVDPIKKILLNHPKNAFFNQEKIDSEFKELNFSDAPDYNESLNEYEAFIDILKSEEIRIPLIIFTIFILFIYVSKKFINRLED